jgi:hypothetical protein
LRTAYDLGNAEVYVRPDVAGDIGIALGGDLVDPARLKENTRRPRRANRLSHG